MVKSSISWESFSTGFFFKYTLIWFLEKRSLIRIIMNREIATLDVYINRIVSLYLLAYQHAFKWPGLLKPICSQRLLRCYQNDVKYFFSIKIWLKMALWFIFMSWHIQSNDYIKNNYPYLILCFSEMKVQ